MDIKIAQQVTITELVLENQKLKQERDEWAAMCGRYKQERDEALMDRANGDIATMTINHYERILRERDEANEELHKQLVRYDQLFDEAEKIRIELAEAREQVQQMSESNQVLMADVRFYRNALKQLKEKTK